MVGVGLFLFGILGYFSCDMLGVSTFVYPDFQPGCSIKNVEVDREPWSQRVRPGIHQLQARVNGRSVSATQYLSNWHSYLRIECDGLMAFTTSMMY
jgi:hypothetical protein